jgi:Stress responsive A/B Barrel Domain
VRMVVLCGVVLVSSVALLHFGSDSMAKDSRATSIEDQMLAHNVFFTLKDKSPEAKRKLVDACKKYLSKHPGTVFFAAGTLCEELDRPVNDRDFDVGLHVIFKTKADQDRYQEAPMHLQFIAENKDNWAKVRVFDSVVGQ